MRRFCYWLRRFIALHIVCLVARRLVFVTDAGRWHFRDGCLFRRVFDRKAVVIWNYLEPETRSPEWRPRQKPLRLIFCGALARRKRFDLAIALMESLRGEDVRLTVVGDGEMAHLLAGHEAIEWHSGLAPPEVIPHYDPVHALLLPTESEACPLVVLEAMARGVFVLASDLPCLRELVSEGETGRLFPVGDLARMKEIVADLLRHPQEAERMGRAALSAAVRFTNGESARQYVEACRDALGER